MVPGSLESPLAIRSQPSQWDIGAVWAMVPGSSQAILGGSGGSGAGKRDL